MRILLLSLYYSPLNNIASTRLTYFAEYLADKGHDVYVISRHYSESNLLHNNLEIGLSETDDLTVPYKVEGKAIYTAFSRNNQIIENGNKLVKGVKGYYFQKTLDAFHYSYVENGLTAFDNELSDLKFDFIVASSPPLGPALLAQKISEKYGIKWVSDFRDSPILDEYPFWIRKVRIRSLRKLLKPASGLLFVSPGMENQNNKYLGSVIQNIPSTIVYNGFFSKDEELDTNIIEQFKEIRQRHSVLLTYTGSVYQERNLHSFLSAINKLNDRNIGVVLVGIQQNYQEEYLNHYSNLSLYCIDKTNYSTSLELQKMSSALLLTIWPNSYTGFSGKVFEYLNSGRPIILDHEPAQDLKLFLTDYKSIHYMQSQAENLKEILDELDSAVIQRDKSLLENTQRSKQADKLLKFLEKIK